MSDMSATFATAMTPEVIAQLVAREERRSALASEIMRRDPSIGFITAIIIAGDRLSAERATELVESGAMEAADAVSHVGSYTRLDFAVRMYEARKITHAWLLTNLPELWRASDPDDTDPRFLKLWKEARRRNGMIVRDSNRGLPRGSTVTVYRGQDRGAQIGIAWTTDRAIAVKYSRGMALRQSNRDGEVLTAKVQHRDVLAFLTMRNESEVIVDPSRINIDQQSDEETEALR